MERTETPLDVLSRAASLVETNDVGNVCFSDKHNTESEISSTSSRLLKQRRQDKNEFGCVPSKYTDHRTAGTQTSMSMINNNDGTRQNNKRARLDNLKQELEDSDEDEYCEDEDDSPLDMTTTSRNSSTEENSRNSAVSGLMQQQRPSVIQCASTLFNHEKPRKDFSDGNRTSGPKLSNRCEVRHGHRREILSGMCDPVIDEHFRRSLGKDYPEYFSSPTVTNNVSISGLSVDDHFAKALGEKWQQIQGKTETADSSSNSASSTNITTQASSPLIQQRHSILST